MKGLFLYRVNDLSRPFYRVAYTSKTKCLEQLATFTDQLCLVSYEGLYPYYPMSVLVISTRFVYWLKHYLLEYK